MKKISAIISAFALTLLMNAQAFAAGASVSFTGNGVISGSGTTTIVLSAGRSSGLSGVCGVSGTLNYDSSKIALTGASASNGFTLTQGKKFVAYRSECISSGGVFSLTFKNKSLSNGGTTTVSFSGVRVSSDSKEVSASNASKTISFKAAQQKQTSTKKSAPRKVSTDTKKEDDKKEEVKKSNDSSLSEILFSVGKIDFSKEVFNYDLVVNNDVNYIEINAKSSDSKAKISGAGKHELKNEKTEVKVVVTAEDGSESTYTINIVKDSQPVVAEPNEEENGDLKTVIMVVAIIVAIAAIGAAVAILVFKKKK